MNKETILEILNDWNFWKKSPYTGLLRPSYLKKMKSFSQSSQIVVLGGVRRSGKSTLMLQYIADLQKKGVAVKNTLYVNLEDPRFFGELSLKLLQDIYEAYLENLEPGKNPYIFLDEVQNISGWEKFARSLHERKEAQVFVSGSSSKLLSGEFGSVLTGRHLMIEVFPLNFQEFLTFKGMEIKNKLDVINNRLKIQKLLKDYLEFGGFPQVVLSKEKKEILLRYFDDVIIRDIIERHKIRKVEKVRALAKFYFTSVASPISFNRLKKFLSLPLDTVERFSYFLSYSYLLFFTRKFSYSLKEQEVNPRKVYTIDTGLRNAICFRFSEDIGRIYENAVFLNLLQNGKEVFYWKNRYECDFVVKKDSQLQAIQVTYDLSNEETKEREVKGLLSVLKKFNLKSGLILNESEEWEEKKEGKVIKIMPLWKWLLE